MDTIIQSRLTKLETALTTLTESIASYNPSVSAAESLIAADDELQASIIQLHTHQKNHARIQSLRQTIDRQNKEIRSTIQLLADTRAELIAIPTSLPPKDRRNVEAGELLGFAKRISRFTVPPNFRPARAVGGGEKKGNNAEAAELAVAESAEATDGAKAVEGIGSESLMDEEKKWLDPWTGVQFTPWPGEEVIRASVLARMQAGIEIGEEMEGVEDTKGEAGDEEKSKEAEEEAAAERERVAKETTASRPVVEKKVEKPRVFGGLDLYDPDAEG